MANITASELDLLGCFEVEPRLLDATVPWVYNEALYSVKIGEWLVSFAIQPSYRDMHLLVQRDGQEVFNFKAVGIADVCVCDIQGVDAVEVVLSDRASLRLQLRPAFGITQRVE